MAGDDTSKVKEYIVMMDKALKEGKDYKENLNQTHEIHNFLPRYRPRVICLVRPRNDAEMLEMYEELKQRKLMYLFDFRTKRSKVRIEQIFEDTMQLEGCSSSIERVDKQLEGCSSSTDEVDGYLSDLKDRIIDGIFLLELFLRLYLGDWEETDRISRSEWTDMKLDLLLVYNQLPFFFLDQLFNLSHLGERYEQLTMLKLAQKFLTEFELLDKDTIEEAVKPGQAIHLLEMVLICMQPLEPRKPTKSVTVNQVSPTIQELNRAGVKFRPASTKRLFDIKFDLKTGILEIPTLKLDETTPIIFYNLIMFEGKRGRTHYMNDYIALMDFLIDRPEDMQLLVQKGIIKNFLPEDIQSLVQKGIMENHRKDVEEVGADFINKLGKVMTTRGDFYYSSLIEDLNEYCQTPWSKLHANVVFRWKSSIAQQYRNNPWVSISIVVATILLILTVIQAVCSILQVV